MTDFSRRMQDVGLRDQPASPSIGRRNVVDRVRAHLDQSVGASVWRSVRSRLAVPAPPLPQQQQSVRPAYPKSAGCFIEHCAVIAPSQLQYSEAPMNTSRAAINDASPTASSPSPVSLRSFGQSPPPPDAGTVRAVVQAGPGFAGPARTR